MKYRLMSFTQPGQFYEVGKVARTCTCPAFTPAEGCKHLEAVGVYRQRHGKLGIRPSFSQALSAVVKGIRVRNLPEAAYWTHYCWSFKERLPGAQYRLVRRMLIGSAEDGHSIAVMEKVAENFPSLLARDTPFERVLAELIRVCKLPNWWHPDSNGPAYIRAGMLGGRANLYRQPPASLVESLEALRQAITKQDEALAVGWAIWINGLDSKSGPSLARMLHELAASLQHPHVQRLTSLYLRHAKALTGDENFLCQAAWLLAGGTSPILDSFETVTLGEIRQLMETINETPPHPVPEWGCDGVHSLGNDIRYAGMWNRMNAVCNQFQHYQRLDPADDWQEEAFFSMEGLMT